MLLPMCQIFANFCPKSILFLCKPLIIYIINLFLKFLDSEILHLQKKLNFPQTTQNHFACLLHPFIFSLRKSLFSVFFTRKLLHCENEIKAKIFLPYYVPNNNLHIIRILLFWDIS